MDPCFSLIPAAQVLYRACSFLSLLSIPRSLWEDQSAQCDRQRHEKKRTAHPEFTNAFSCVHVKREG